ncbi:MAG: plasmid maintenance protein CcdB [Betaproteobacteria bacterium]|nr:MAG: plasmid maintenance protein CcdB [Betaproteobacteria bacterium]TAG48577.1 MAG: plasmid maintenance protein CcdB [Betaproteobacteria bacterium]
MAQFDVYRLPRDFLPFTHAVNMQSDLVTDIPTRACIPLAPVSKAHVPATRLNPTIDVDGEKMFVMTQHIEALPVDLLKKPVISVGVERFALTSALDFLFQGY